MGCRVCRARKVKCDGRPNGCRNCERLQLDCIGDNGAVSLTSTSPEHRSSSIKAASTTSSASLRKIRTYRSCTSCRLSKTKCNGDRPRCSRCSDKEIECVYDGGSAPRWTRNLNQNVKKEDGDEDLGARARSEENDKGSSEPRGADSGTSSRERSSLQTPSTTAPPITSHSFALDSSDTLAWLFNAELPAPRHIRRLVEHYFANVHPIRCFAFVHKPSFMRQLDSGFTSDDDSALLHIICAHGAKFHALNLSHFDQVRSNAFLRNVGNQWAKKAEAILLDNYGKISTHRLMAVVLLHDYQLRMDEHGQALMLSGLAVRMAQALKLNTEYSPDIMCTGEEGPSPSVVSRESRRRLMWACYVLDVWTGSGSDQLALWRESDIKVQLPCNERNFGLRIPCVTETLAVGHVLQSLSPAIVPPKPASNMGIMAYYIRITTLRKRIMRYIHNIDSNNNSPPPWSPESEFSALDADLGHWRRQLPDFVEYSPDTIYARLDSNQLGGLMLIHCTYHHNYLELYKISMPDLYRLRPPPTSRSPSPPSTSSSSFAAVFPAEHTELLQALQADCYFHAREIARLLAEAAEHGIRLLSDSVLPFLILDSSRVLLYYVARLLDPDRMDASERFQEAVEAVEGNKKLLRMMAPLFPVSETFCATVERWLLKVKGKSPSSVLSGARPSVDLASAGDVEMSSATSTSASFTLPPMAAYRPPLSSPTIERPFSRSTSWTAVNEAHAVASNGNKSPSLTGWGGEQQQQHQHHGYLGGQVASLPDGQRKRPICEGLDLDDLQNFLSWDVFMTMDQGERGVVGGVGGEFSMTEYEMEGSSGIAGRSSEWGSAV